VHEKKNFAIVKIFVSPNKKTDRQTKNKTQKSAQKKRDVLNGVIIVIIARL